MTSWGVKGSQRRPVARKLPATDDSHPVTIRSRPVAPPRVTLLRRSGCRARRDNPRDAKRLGVWRPDVYGDATLENRCCSAHASRPGSRGCVCHGSGCRVVHCSGSEALGRERNLL